jgi:hypothetical protein
MKRVLQTFLSTCLVLVTFAPLAADQGSQPEPETENGINAPAPEEDPQAGQVSPQAEEAPPPRGPQRDPLDPVPTRLRALQIAGGDAPVGAGTLFNPAISVILDTLFARFSDELDEPPGFALGHDHGHDDDHGHGVVEGFQLREAELTFTGAVDPYFDMLVTASITASSIELEEAWVNTRSLPAGLQIKAGKFLSDVGYINKQHPHQWHFVDQPWMRELLFGEEGLNEVGIQLSWLAPTATYLRFAFEALEGTSEGVASYLGDGNHEIVTILPRPDGSPQRIRYRAGKGLTERAGPRLFTGIVKWAPDLGFDHALQLGAFGGLSRVWQSEEAHSSGRLETWDGDGRFFGADLVYKLDRQGILGHRNLLFQAEYARRDLDLLYQSRQFTDFSTLVPTHGGPTPDVRDQSWRQDAFYAQAVYGFAPRWTAGLRWDVAGLTNRGADEEADFLGRLGMPVDFETSHRYSAQVTFAPTEFSRVRAQVSYNDLAGEHGNGHGHDGVWQAILQLNLSLGVHGAHEF